LSAGIPRGGRSSATNNALRHPDRPQQICALQALSERIARYFPSAM
jgi:hypothetical protein